MRIMLILCNGVAVIMCIMLILWYSLAVIKCLLVSDVKCAYWKEDKVNKNWV